MYSVCTKHVLSMYFVWTSMLCTEFVLWSRQGNRTVTSLCSWHNPVLSMYWVCTQCTLVCTQYVLSMYWVCTLFELVVSTLFELVSHWHHLTFSCTSMPWNTGTNWTLTIRWEDVWQWSKCWCVISDWPLEVHSTYWFMMSTYQYICYTYQVQSGYENDLHAAGLETASLGRPDNRGDFG